MQSIHPAILTEPIIYEINQIDKLVELENIMLLKKNYQQYLKTIVDSKKQKGTFRTIIEDVEKRHPDIETNLPITITESSDKNFNIITLEVRHNSNLVLRKKLFFSKTVDIDEELKTIDIEVDRSNLILKLKNVMDLTNKSGSEFVSSEKYAEIKDQFEQLKLIYTRLIGKKEKLIQFKNKSIKQKLSNISSLVQRDINLSKTVINSGYAINQLDEITLADCLEYFSSLLKLNNFKGFSKELDVNKIIEFKMDSSNARYMGYVKEIDDSNKTITVLPLFQNELLTINMTDMTSDGSLLGINEELIVKKNNLFSISNNQINESTLFNKNKISSIVVEKYFDGNNYIVSDIKYLEAPELQTESPVVQTTINIINDGRYPINNELLFNVLGSKFIVGKNSLSSSPGKGINELLISDDELNGNFEILKSKSNWRKKLDESYIRKLITPQGETIIPIVIDGKQFASIIHYYHYNKFIDSGFSGRKLNQYNNFAKRYCLDNNGNLSKLSGPILAREARKLEIPRTKNWNTLKNDVIKKATLAKFAQNDDLAQILSATKDAALLYSTNKQRTKLRYEYELMEVRSILKNDSYADFYPNYLEETVNARDIVSKIMTTAAKTSNIAKKDMQERDEFENAVLRGNLNASEDEVSNMDKSVEILKEKGMYVPGMSIKNINDALLNISLEQQDTYIADLMSNLESKLNEKGLFIKEVPANGDCLYYSIIEGLKHNNVMPNEFNSNYKFIDTRWGIETNFQPVDVGATQDLRNMIADKLQINILENSDEPSINAITLSMGNVQDYISNVRNMANANEAIDGKTGAWGSYIELNVASALLKLDFDIISDKGNVIEIRYVNTSLVFNKGEKMGLDRDVVKLNLGYVSGKHYVYATNKSIVLRNDTEYELINVFVIDVPVGDQTYKFATYISNDIQLLGLYDSITGKIQTTIDDEELQEQLGDIVYNYWDDESNSRDPKENSDIQVVEYWQDKSNNKLYSEKNGQLEVGEITIEEDENGEKYIELNFL